MQRNKVKWVIKMKIIAIIGGGPSGLGCASELSKQKKIDQKVIILDKNNTVGGLSRSIVYKKHIFDLGPHRFFTKNKIVLKLWKNILGNELMSVKRRTRILYNGTLFTYPIELGEILRKISIGDKIQIITSFIHSKFSLFSDKPKSFEEWCIKNFGKKLYLMFFKNYTEKVWGIPCNKLHVKWAEQRIKNLSLTSIIINAIFRGRIPLARSLINTFYYPKGGAGSFYKRAVKKYKLESSLRLNSTVSGILHDNNKIRSLEYITNNDKRLVKINYLFSSMPITHFILSLKPRPPQYVIDAANKMYYRDHITINLIVKNHRPFPDQWIYIHSSSVKMARITNYSNFNDDLKSKKTIAISVEYFTFKKDVLWKKNDNQLLELAKNEVDKTGLVESADIVDGFVVRETESYPTYYLNYNKSFKILKHYVSSFTNVQLIGRGGMYKYNNMDHALYSGILAAKNYVAGYSKYDVWNINEDGPYLEEK